MGRRLSALVSCFLLSATPSIAATIVVPAGGDLQRALNQAQPGDTILLAAGATYTGNFVLPAKNGSTYITIRSNAADASLPRAGERITPAFAAALPKLQSPAGAGGAPALSTAPFASYYVIQFIEFLPNASGEGAMLALGSADASQNSLEVVPHDLIVDRCYLHSFADQAQLRGIALNSAATTIRDSYISEIKYAGADSQAIGGWNGPGPYTIVNNYLQAAGENMMFGGATMFIPNVSPSDIEVRNNYLTKDPAWRGSRWTVKNLFELKHARNVVLDGNVLEYCWQAAQDGSAILFTVRDDAPWSSVQRVTVTNNLVRHVASAFNLLGVDNHNPALPQGRSVTIRNNVFEDVSAANWGGAGRFMLISEFLGVTVDHNTVFNSGSAIHVYNGTGTSNSAGFVFTNNIVNAATYGIIGDGAGEGNGAIAKYFPTSAIAGNLFVGCTQSWNYPAGNFFPATSAAVGLVGLASGDYHLAAGSPYKGKATDGRDPGADIDLLVAALVASDAPPVTPAAPPPTTEPPAAPPTTQPPPPAPQPVPVPAPVPPPEPTPVPAPAPAPVPPASPFPAGWTLQDIGVVGLAGSGTYGAGTFTMTAAGREVWGTADSFALLHEVLPGDGQVIARVAALGGSASLAKAGIMIRESLSPSAAAVLLDVRIGGAVELLARPSSGAAAVSLANSKSGRQWLRLVRSGSLVTAYSSGDGRRWVTVGKATIAVGATAYVGLAVCSYDPSRLVNAAFDNVLVTTAWPRTTRSVTAAIALPRSTVR